MNLKQENRHIVDALFVLALFCVFAFSALMLVSVGGAIYQKTVDDMDFNYNSRTAFSYVTEKLRQNDVSSAISAGSLEGRPAVILTQDIDGTRYLTYLYEYEGYLQELLVRSGLQVSDTMLDAGHPVLKLSAFELTEVSPCLYHFILTDENGDTFTLYISTSSSLD